TSAGFYPGDSPHRLPALAVPVAGFLRFPLLPTPERCNPGSSPCALPFRIRFFPHECGYPAAVNLLQQRMLVIHHLAQTNNQNATWCHALGKHVQEFPAPPAAEINKHVLAINNVLRLQRTSGQIKNIDLTETAALTQLVVDLQRLTGLLRFKTNGRISL